ncbi:MAG: hypothetical protein KY468_10235 [Armatimonadetes bacterium]|nr:hypothetical protein [Armatimonadota bacterium]
MSPPNDANDVEEDDEILLICLQARPKERPYVEGAVIKECRDCRCPIWLAPSGQQMERERGAQLVCMTCATERMKDDPEAKIQKPTPEQMKEIEKTLRWNEARRFRGKTDTV